MMTFSHFEHNLDLTHDCEMPPFCKDTLLLLDTLFKFFQGLHSATGFSGMEDTNLGMEVMTASACLGAVITSDLVNNGINNTKTNTNL